MYIMLNNRPLNTADILSISEVKVCKEKIVEIDGITYFKKVEPNDPEEYSFSIRVKGVLNSPDGKLESTSNFIYSQRYKEKSRAQAALEHLLSEINDLWGSLKHINI